MRRIVLLAALLCAATATARPSAATDTLVAAAAAGPSASAAAAATEPARPDTVYVPHGARRTPQVERTTRDGRIRRLKSLRMRGDTLTRDGVCFVRLPRLMLFLCIGQSNMAGRGWMDSAAREAIPGVFMLNSEGCFERAAEPLNRYSTIRKELSMQRIGPAGSFARAMAARTGCAVGLVVNARGDTSIERWQPEAPEGYFREAVRRIRVARAWGDVTGVVWHQGEADVRRPERYEAQFRHLVERLRAELGDESLPVVYGEIARWNWTGRAEGTEPFNRMVRAIAIPRAACVSSEGLTPLRDESDPHFSTPSQRELGRRYAEAMLRLLDEQ